MIKTINTQTFLVGLLISSTVTSLTTEALKKLFAECNKKYYANVLAGVVALIVSAAIGVGYILLGDIGFTTQNIVYLVALVFLSWLCSMVGYDKVVQAIAQFRK